VKKPARVTHDWNVFMAACEENSIIWSQVFHRINRDLNVRREQAAKLAREEVKKYREKNPFPWYEDAPQDVHYAVNGRVVSDRNLGGGEPVPAPILPSSRKRFKTPLPQRVFRGGAQVHIAQNAGGLYSYSDDVASDVHE